MRYTIKWRFLLKLGVVVLVAGAGIFFLHRWQVGRQVDAFLHQANLARDAGEREQQAGNREQALAEHQREEDYLRRYALARPDDIDARDRLGRLMVRAAKSRKQFVVAYYFLEEVLRRDESRDDLRRFTVDLAIQLGLYKEAQVHLDILVVKRPNDGELAGLTALCLVQEKKDYPEAAKFFKKAIEHRPELLGSYRGLALLRRLHLGQTTEADDTIHEMVAKNPKEFRAHLLAADYWREYGTRGKVEKAVGDAQRLAPEELDVLVAAADVSRVQARIKARERTDDAKAEAEQLVSQARQLLTRAMAQDKARKVPAVYLAMASLEAEARQVPDAIAAVRKGLAEVPDSTDLLQGLLEYQHLANDGEGMRDTLEKLKSHARGVGPGIVEYQQARILALQDKWKDAAPLLVRAIPLLTDPPRLARQANVLLGQCYEQLGEHGKRFAPYTDALNRPTPLDNTDPLWVAGTLGIAETHAALGESAKALATYREMTATVPGVWVQVARLELIRAVSAPKSPEKWRLVEEALVKAEQAAKERFLPDDLDVQILRATLAHHQERPADARARLEALRKSRPKEKAVWLELALQDAREEKLDQALATLAAAEKEVGDSPDLRLTRAAILSLTKDSDLPAKIAALAVGGEKFGVGQHRRLLRGLAEAAARAGADELAGRLWEDLARAKPFDLSVHLTRFDRASRTGNTDAMKQLRASIAEIDGENGQSTRLADAFIRIYESLATNDRAKRDQALALLDGLERELVGSPVLQRVLLSQALIHNMNGSAEAAKEKYRQARSLGNLPADAARRFVELLLVGSSDADAEQASKLMEELRNTPAWGADLQRLAAVASLRLDNPEKAREFAEDAVKQDSKNYRDQIWLGRIYWFGKEQDKLKAEGRFREAVRLAPDAMDAWLILIEYLAATERRAEAEKVFEEAKDKVKKAERGVFLAMGYTKFGQIEKAIKAYEQARIENPNDLRILMAEAEFLFQNGKLAEARAGFERVKALPGATEADRRTAHQGYLLATAADPNYAEAKKALELLGKAPGAPPDPTETPAQRRSRAVIFALQKDRASKLEAIRLLEGNPEGRTPGEQFLLAQLHNQVGNRKQVPVVMTDLLKTQKNRIPLYTGFFAMWLIRDGKLSEAETWVAVLEKTDAKSLSTAELRARLALAHKVKDEASARAALQPHIDAPDAPLGLLSRICEDIGLYPEAEQLLKKFVEQKKATEPAVVLALATYHGRRARTAEALQIWDEWREKFPAPQIGGVAVAILANAAPPAKTDLDRVAKWIDEAAEKAKGKPNERAALLQQLAAVRNLQGDYAGSATLYMRALAENPRDVLAMNNLAYLLAAEHKKYDEALELINRAKNQIGPDPELRDTEALILMLRSQYKAARDILEIVVVEAPSGPGFFHLAMAEDALVKDEARDSWRRALELGVKLADLHPLEHPDFERIRKKY